LLAGWVVTVSDLVPKGFVCCALRFFQNAACVILFIAALEPNTTIWAKDFAAREPASVIQLITNRLAQLAIPRL